MIRKDKLKLFFKANKASIFVSFVTSLLVFILFLFIFITFVYINPALDKNIFSTNNTKEVVLGKNTKTQIQDEFIKESVIVDIVQRVDPAVVSIVITKDVPIIEQYYEEFDPFGNDLFNNFFGNDGFKFRIPQQRQKGTEEREVGGGSGFFISKDGLLITNRHVVNDEDAKYTVLTNDGKKYDAKVLARDTALDIAVLKVKGSDFSYLKFGNSDILKPGQTVIAIGNALAEFRNSVSVGVVSGLSRSIVAGDSFGNSELLEGVIQTDAAINPGNSGGPLLNLKGEVIGVNVAVQRGAENIGFALPGNMVKNISDSVKKHGEIVKPYIGVRYIQVTERLKEKNNLAVDYGALVIRGESIEELAVIPGSPADKAGIVENDIILEIDGVKLKKDKSLASVIRQKQIGQKIKLKLLHKGKEKIVELVLEKAPNNL